MGQAGHTGQLSQLSHMSHKKIAMQIKTYSKTELANLYEVHYETFIKWLKRIPDLDLEPNQRILTPKQVEKVFSHLGKPD
jgi:transposase